MMVRVLLVVACVLLGGCERGKGVGKEGTAGESVVKTVAKTAVEEASRCGKVDRSAVEAVLEKVQGRVEAVPQGARGQARRLWLVSRWPQLKGSDIPMMKGLPVRWPGDEGLLHTTRALEALQVASSRPSYQSGSAKLTKKWGRTMNVLASQEGVVGYLQDVRSLRLELPKLLEAMGKAGRSRESLTLFLRGDSEGEQLVELFAVLRKAGVRTFNLVLRGGDPLFDPSRGSSKGRGALLKLEKSGASLEEMEEAAVSGAIAVAVLGDGQELEVLSKAKKPGEYRASLMKVWEQGGCRQSAEELAWLMATRYQVAVHDWRFVLIKLVDDEGQAIKLEGSWAELLGAQQAFFARKLAASEEPVPVQWVVPSEGASAP